MVGGRQYVNVSNGADVPIVVHELGHTLGFFHEHQRFDRNEYVRFNSSCAAPGSASAFERQAHRETYLSAYDYASIMHYSSYTFATRWGCPTLVKRGGSPVPEQVELSAKDIASFKRLYPLAR